MIGKQIVALALLSAMADQTLAAPGHQHRQLHAVEKRAVEVEVVTKIVTVTVTYGAEPTKDDKGGIFVSVPDTTSTSVVAAPTVEKQVDNQKPASSSSSAQVQENAKQPSTSTSTSTAAVTTTAQPTTTAEPTTTAQPTTTAVPSSSSTSSAAPASSSSSGNSGPTTPTLSKKRGIGYNSATMGTKLKDANDVFGWSYNWETQPKGGPSGFYIPTYKSNKDNWPKWFDDQAQSSISSSSVGVAFSLNEPDNAAEGLVTPELAATLQVTHMVAMKEKTGVAISAPSVTNGQGSDQGLNWLQSFVTACKATATCHYDFCNLHWYDYEAAEDSLFSNLKKAHEICGTPVWLTEFALLDGDDQKVAEWIKKVIPQLDALDYVQGYAYFMAGNAYQEQFNLFNPDGVTLNKKGLAYAGLSF
ncbi:unnamed protein product [Clonostachys chloroleuca]|uniref:Asl1-like glycosyl hydrolase catalytic domain-containing protein n=1 Tax=Clonostachys chloroleuca TaxID=1926264 RepID=A0AA35QAI9_9HYPO|nr:unnamed protein product [Clonostachys chloroleuca]